MLYVSIMNDPDTMNPLDGEWKILQAGREAGMFHPDRVDDGLRWLIDKGTAFWLDKFEHSGEWWYLHGEVPPMLWHDFVWDGTEYAGILLVPEALWHEDSEVVLGYARSSMRAYNEWLAGDCYHFWVDEMPDDGGEDRTLESCGGFIGESGACEMVRQINSALGGREWIQAIGSEIDARGFLERYGK